MDMWVCAKLVPFSAGQGQCKEYTSYYRKLATKTVSIQQEELQEH